VKKQASEADREGPQFPIAVNAIGISDASIVIDDPVGTSGVNVPKRVDHLDAKLAFRYEPVRYSLDIDHVSFRGSDPSIGLNALSGHLSVRDDAIYFEKVAVRTEETSMSLDGDVRQYTSEPIVNIRVSSDKLSIPELAPIVPALAGISLEPAFELALAGPLNELHVEMNVRSTAGDVAGKLVIDAVSPPLSVDGTVSTRQLDLAQILGNRAMRSNLTATAQLHLKAADVNNLDTLQGTLSIDTPKVVLAGYTADKLGLKTRFVGRRALVEGHAAAYGAVATVNGRVSIPAEADPLSFDLSGKARKVDLRRLPIPAARRVETDVNADYRVRGVYAASKRGSALQILTGDLVFADSTAAGVRIGAGSRAGVSLDRGAIGYTADAEVSGVDLQHIGEALKIQALSEARYKTDLNGHLTARGQGTDPSTMSATASGTLQDSSLLGGHVPALTFEASLSGDAARVKASGRFVDIDPSAATGRPEMKGTVAGAFDVEATVAHVSAGVTVDAVSARVNASLEPSSVGGVSVDRLVLDGEYRDRIGEIRQFEVAGHGLNAEASGTLSLDEGGQSDLRYKADSSDLAQLGSLANVPISGIASVEGTIEGNASELRASGTFVGSDIKYQGNGALSSTSTYTVTLPELDVEKLKAVADTKATFVSVAGQDINQLSAKTTYADQELTFDATAEQPKRTLSAAGTALFHPDHQEVHVERLALQTAGIQWQLAPNSSSAIQYGDGRVAVEPITLVNGEQQVQVAGAFGQPGDELTFTMKAVDLASVDAVLLRQPQLSGRLDANGTLSGSSEAPSLQAEFRIDQGGFRQFRYDTFGGTVAYSGSGVTVDAKLQQNAAQWISAKGYVPTATFTSQKSEEQIDLVVDSSPIDLGLVQGFTTALTGVAGTLEAHVRVKGTAGDPHPEGTLTIADGAATVQATGVPYRHIAGRIDLQPDRVHIGQLTVLDNHDSALSITGDLAVHERQVGGVQVYVTAQDFKVIDNKMGNVRVQSSLEIGGELTSPRIEGYAGISTGSVNLDEVLANTTDSAYATKAIEYTPKPGEAAQPQARPSMFDALKMNVGFSVPNDLVIKASSIETPGSPIGLGALNLTLGGDLRFTKEPADTVRITGQVNTIRGTYDFQGRRFDILRDGTIRFAGLDMIDPDLDIRTMRLIQGVEARANVRGRLSQPQIVLTSTPPLEPADILALVVFNQPINQLGEGDQISLAARAQAMAAGAVAGGLSQSIARALNLDVFEINVAPESQGGTQLTVGQQLGQSLYVKVEQGLGDQGTTNFILEYELLKWLRLQTNMLQGSSTQQSLFRRQQDSGADLIFFFSY